MRNSITPKIVLLSTLYLIISIVLISILDIGLAWLLNNVIFSVLNWFNRLNWIFKILVLLLGGGSLFLALLETTGRISTFLGGLIFNRLPQNLFTIIAPLILAVANAMWYIIAIWKIPEHYNFWIVCELISLSGFIWQLSAIVMPAKEQIRTFRDERYN